MREYSTFPSKSPVATTGNIYVRFRRGSKVTVRASVMLQIAKVFAALAVIMFGAGLMVTTRAMGDALPSLPEPPAEPGPTPQPVIVSAQPPPAAAGTAQELPYIFCTINASTPVYLLSNKQITTQGKVDCVDTATGLPYPVANITVTSQLWYSPAPFLPSIEAGVRGFADLPGLPSLATSSSGPCLLSGNYFGGASALVIFPIGYFPPTTPLTFSSGTVPINC